MDKGNKNNFFVKGSGKKMLMAPLENMPADSKVALVDFDAVTLNEDAKLVKTVKFSVDREKVLLCSYNFVDLSDASQNVLSRTRSPSFGRLWGRSDSCR